MTHYYSNYISILKALSDETRLKIIQMLSQKQMCANDRLECFSMTQPSLSYHMKILTTSGLVRARRQSGFTIYTVDAAALEAVRSLMDLLLEGDDVENKQQHP